MKAAAVDARKTALVQQSFEKVAALGVTVAEIFYAELFAIDPSLRSMFSGDMQDQHRKLLSALAYVVRSLHAPEKILNSVENLGRVHVDYGVKPEHYTYVGNALLRTLKKGLGTQFTPELCDAWTEAFRTLARIMKDAAYGEAPARVRGAA
jgi:hemoglobin-like flavoprotein